MTELLYVFEQTAPLIGLCVFVRWVQCDLLRAHAELAALRERLKNIEAALVANAPDDTPVADRSFAPCEAEPPPRVPLPQATARYRGE